MTITTIESHEGKSQSLEEQRLDVVQSTYLLIRKIRRAISRTTEPAQYDLLMDAQDTVDALAGFLGYGGIDYKATLDRVEEKYKHAEDGGIGQSGGWNRNLMRCFTGEPRQRNAKNLIRTFVIDPVTTAGLKIAPERLLCSDVLVYSPLSEYIMVRLAQKAAEIQYGSSFLSLPAGVNNDRNKATLMPPPTQYQPAFVICHTDIGQSQTAKVMYREMKQQFPNTYILYDYYFHFNDNIVYSHDLPTDTLGVSISQEW